jgi:lysophospholipase L1-like esterase
MRMGTRDLWRTSKTRGAVIVVTILLGSSCLSTTAATSAAPKGIAAPAAARAAQTITSSRATSTTSTSMSTMGTNATYVAMGDSYSSGQGLAARASQYIAPSGSDGCHRATDAYPEIVAHELGQAEPASGWFVACSGTTAGALLRGQDGELPQTDALTPSTSEISLTTGGNNVGFASTAEACIKVRAQLGHLSVVSPYIKKLGNCASDEKRAADIVSGGAATSTLGEALTKTYATILSDAPNARLAVLTYPQLLTTTNIPSFCPLTRGVDVGSANVTLGFSKSDVVTIDRLESATNEVIMNVVDQLGAEPIYAGRIAVTNMTPLTLAHAQPCDLKTMNASYLNGIQLTPGHEISQFIACKREATVSCNGLVADDTLHPTAKGHRVMAEAVIATFGQSSW